MRLNDLDREEYRDIPLMLMRDNNNGMLPVYIRTHCAGVSSGILHRHEMIQINYVNRGTLLHEINGMQYELIRGDIFVIPPFIPHKLDRLKDRDYEIIELEFLPEFVFQGINIQEDIHEYSSFIDFSYIEPFLVSEHNVRPRLNLSGEKRVAIEGLLGEFFAEYKDRADGYLLALRALLLKLLMLLGRYFRQSTETDSVTQVYNRHRDAIEKAVQYLEEHYGDALSLDEVAKIAMLSPSYFSYLFKAITGKTVIEYLTARRIARASQLLRETDLQVVEISLEAGFNSVAHFNRTFKAVAGVSPTKYRKLSGQDVSSKP